MEKIQMDAILAAQMMSQTSRYQTTDLTKTDFSKLLKGQNTAVSQTRDAKTPEKPSPKKDSEAVKDTGAKEPTDTETEESEETKDSETIPAELLLQLQEAAGLLTAQPTQTECIEPGLTETTGQEVTVESIPEPATQEPGQTEGMMPTVPEEGVPEGNLLEEPMAPAVEEEILTAEEIRTTPQKQPAQEAQTESVKADSPKEESKETKALEASQTSSEPQAKEETTVPVKAQTESQSGGQTKEETQPQQAFSGMEHLQLRNSSVGEVKGADAGTATVRTTEATLVEDVGRTLAERFPQKDGMLTIELEPASLGKLTVQVLYEGGRAMVSILATNPKTLELLSQKASELGAILEEHTGQETIVYTEQPEAEQPYDERQREGERREQEPDSEEQQSDRASQESFAQQLRLGLL